MKKTIDEKFFSVISYTFTFVIALICFLPFWLIVIGSFTSESEIIARGYSLWPSEFSVEAYKMVFQLPERIFKAYGVSIFITVLGGGISLFITAMSAFVLMRKDFEFRNKIALFFYFPTIFSGGMIPSYILVVKYLNLKDNILALILPGLLGAWNIFLMRNFMKSIPDSIMESAKLDGANEIVIAFRIYFPLSIPVLAAVTLFYALGYWNDWWNAIMLIDNNKLYPLQYFLFKLQSEIKMLRDLQMQSASAGVTLPSESVKMATVIVTIGPIIFLYPFLQKYFVKGLVIGGVKG